MQKKRKDKRMMKDKIIITESNQLRLDQYLSGKLGFTRSRIQGHIKSGEITLNGLTVKTGYILKAGDIVLVNIKDEVKLDLIAKNLNLNIIYEDSDIIVVNKPSGLVVHPASSYLGDTLVHGLLYQADSLSTINGVIRPGIVHRIDKDTSGLLLVAKNDTAHKKLSEDLKNKKIKRQYLGIVYGKPDESEGIISTFIARDPKNRLKMAVTRDGKPATTRFNVIEFFDAYSFVSFDLETGRTHQIRVHTSYIGHPLLGDPLYGPKKVFGDKGQFLHAFKLSFIHPVKNIEMSFEAPLPDYFEEELMKIRQE